MIFLNGSIPYHNDLTPAWMYIALASVFTVIIEWIGMYVWLQRTSPKTPSLSDTLFITFALNMLTLVVGLVIVPILLVVMP